MQHAPTSPGSSSGQPAGNVAMKAQKSDPHLNSLMIASHHKAKNTQPARLRKNALADAQTRLIPHKNDKTRLAHVKTLQAQIDANAYRVDNIAIAQHMLKSSMTRRMLDLKD